MLCERCKIREANVQYTEIVNGVKTEHNYCSHCAKELDFGPYSAIFDSEFPLGKLLSGLLGVGGNHEEEKTCQVVCPACGTSYEEFVKDSRFGCADCYGVFDLLISDKIKQLQGNDTHKGKKPLYFRNGEGMPGLDHLSEAAGSGAESGETGTDTENGAGAESGVKHVKEQIHLLDVKLKEALKREEYELAAQCRDKIRTLREEMGEC